MNFTKLSFSLSFKKRLFLKTHFDAKNVFEFQQLVLQLDTGSRCRKVNSTNADANANVNANADADANADVDANAHTNVEVNSNIVTDVGA